MLLSVLGTATFSASAQNRALDDHADALPSRSSRILSPDPDVYIPVERTAGRKPAITLIPSFDRNGKGLAIPLPKSPGNKDQAAYASISTWYIPGVSEVDEERKKAEEKLRQGLGNVLGTDIPDPSAMARKLVDLSEYDPSTIDWPKIDTPNVNWSTVDITKIDWSKVDVSQIRWEELDVSKVDWSKIDPSKMDWRAAVLDQIDLSKLSPEWQKVAEQLKELCQKNLWDEFEKKAKSMTWEDVKKAGSNMLYEVAIDYAKQWIDSPQGLDIRNAVVRNHPWFEQVKFCIKLAKDNGIITSAAQCTDYSQKVAEGVGMAAKYYGANPATEEGVKMFSKDMGDNACKDVMRPQVQAGQPASPSPAAPAALNGSWEVGKGHPDEAYLVSSELPGHWHPAPGFEWDDRSRLSVRWQPGLRHPRNPHCISSSGVNRWHPEDGYKINPDQPSVPHVVCRTLDGVGAEMLLDSATGYLKIIGLAKGGALDSAGIQKGTLILSAEGVSTRGVDPRTTIDKYLSASGAREVTLTFQLPGKEQTWTKKIVKSPIPSRAYPSVSKKFYTGDEP